MKRPIETGIARSCRKWMEAAVWAIHGRDVAESLVEALEAALECARRSDVGSWPTVIERLERARAAHAAHRKAALADLRKKGVTFLGGPL